MAIDEDGSEIRELDRYNSLRMLTELRKHPHPLTHQSDSLYNTVNGQVVSETKVHVQDVVEIGQDTGTSFASSLPGGFHHPIKKRLRQCKSRSVGRRLRGENCIRLGSSFPTSLVHLRVRLHDQTELGIAQGSAGNARTFSQSHIPMEYSLKRTSTNLIHSWGRTVLLGDTSSQ